jgi:transcriptional regulator with XRE-family HTH domain
VSIGEVLTAARRQAGLTITQVSQRTRIRETIIRGIERDDFSACGGDFYARGHIRAIARAAGADPDPLIQEYDASHGTPQASAAAGVPGPAAPLRLRERRRTNWGVALLVVLAAVIGLVVYHLVASQPAGRGTAAGRTPAAAHQAGRRHPAAKNTAAPPAARHGSSDVVISLTAVSEPCWADLTTSGGAEIFQGIIDPHLGDLDGTAGSHLAARQPRRGHADGGRQEPRARAGPGHAEPGTRSGNFPVAPARPRAAAPARCGMTIVVDAGALIGLDRDERPRWVRLKAATSAGDVPVTHAGDPGTDMAGRPAPGQVAAGSRRHRRSALSARISGRRCGRGSWALPGNPA